MIIAFVHLNRYQEIGSTDFYELSQALGRKYTDAVHVIVAREGESQAYLAGSVTLHEIPVPARRMWSRASIEFYRSAASLLCDLKPNLVIVVFDRGAALIPWIVRRRMGMSAPKFYHHTYQVSTAKGAVRYRISNLLTKLESLGFDAVIVHSSSIAKAIYGDEFPRPIYIVSPGVNLEKFSFQPKEREELRKGLGKDVLLFVYVGTMAALKNVDHIIEAFDMANLGGAARLWMVGDGPMMGELKNIIESRSKSNIQLLGRCEYASIPGILSAADVAISHLEASSRFFLQPPIKVLEYLSAGTIVLASDVAGNRLYLEGSDAAKFYAPSGVTGLAVGFKNIFEEKSKLNTKDTRAKARATAEKFSWDRIASDFLVSLSSDSHNCD